MDTSEWVQVGVGIVLTLTLGAVLWYAWETRKLAKETREQRILATRPALLLYPLAQDLIEGSASEIFRLVFSSSPDNTPVKIANIGAGVAIDVRVPYLDPEYGPKERVMDYLHTGAHETEKRFYLAPTNGDQKALRVVYSDIFGNRYESVRKFYKEGTDSFVFTPITIGEIPTS